MDATGPGGADGSEAPLLAIPEAEDDGFVNAVELADGVQALVALTDGTQAGDTVLVEIRDGTGALVAVVEHVVRGEDVASTPRVVVIEIPQGAFADGESYQVVARIVDPAGQRSAPSNPVGFMVDLTSPGGTDGMEAPVLTIPEAADGFIDAGEHADGIEAQVTLTPGTRPGDIVLVEVRDGNGSLVGTAKHAVLAADLGAGGIAVTLDEAWLADGESYRVVACIEDAAGNRSAPSNTVIFAVDLTSPGGADGSQAPVLAVPEADDGYVNASELGDGGVEARVGLTAGTQAGDTVVVELRDAGGTLIDALTSTVQAADLAAGAVELQIPAGWLRDGASYQVTARIVDPAGQGSAHSNSVGFVVDLTSPGGAGGTDAPVLVIPEAADGFINAEEHKDGVEAEVRLTPGTQAGDTVLVTVRDAGGTPVGTVEHVVRAAEVAAGTVGVRLAQAWLNHGKSYGVVARIEDAAGNGSAPSNEITFAVNLTPPNAPALTIPEADDGHVNAAEAEDGKLEAKVTLPAGTAAGDTVVLAIHDGNGAAVGVPLEYVVQPQDVAPGATRIVSIDIDASLLGHGQSYAVVAFIRDQAQQESPTSIPVEFVVDLVPPSPPAVELALDTGIGVGADSDGITSVGTVSVGDLEPGAYWEYSHDGGATWHAGSGSGFVLPPGDYDIGDVLVRQIDRAGNAGAAGALPQRITVIDLAARHDLDLLDLGAPDVQAPRSVSAQDVQVLGLAEGVGGSPDALTSFVIADGQVGDVVIEIRQTALLAVADAYRVEVYDADGNLVYAGATPGTLVGSGLANLQILGLTGNDTLTATLTGLRPGSYSVLVRNDKSKLGSLLDSDGGGISLKELGDAGVVLGPHNQKVVLDTVDEVVRTALGPLLGGLLAPVVSGLVGGLLNTLNGLGVGALVDGLADVLEGLGLLSLLDRLTDMLANNLLSNTLDLLESTSITTTVTEYSFPHVVETGNVITGGTGADTIVPGTLVQEVRNANGESVAVPAAGSVKIAGRYGELEIDVEGNYSYTAYGSAEAVGKTDSFTYTISDGTNAAQATLDIQIVGAVDGGAPQGSEGSERPAHEDEASVLLDDGSFVLSFAYDGGGGDVPASGMDAPPAAAVPLMDLGHALPLQDDLALPPDVHAEAL